MPSTAQHAGNTVTFHSLTAAVSVASTSPTPSPPTSSSRLILSSASGHIRGGSLCALLGASGAGKSTLLNCLARREETAVLSGRVLIDGRVQSSAYFARHCAFVPQQSSLLPALTTRETIAFASHMKLPWHTAELDHTHNVDRIIAALGLGRCADSQVGDDIVGGLSGGEKRRINVGVELVTRPSVLFLDEPTTGLDSHTALGMIRCLKRLTSLDPREEKEVEPDSASPLAASPAPVTVILSIHQPNYELFALFDDLILLSEGHVLYCGPASQALQYFDQLGLPCPAYTNPPEHLLDIAQGTIGEEQRTLQLLTKAYAHHIRHNDSHLSLDSVARPLRSPSAVIPQALPFHLQLLYLLRRSHLCVSRSPLLKIAQVLQSLVLGLLVGLSFIHLGLSQSSVQNRLGAVYFIILCTIFANTFAVVLTFAEERAVFLREQRSAMYRVSAYFIARTAVDALPTLVCSVVFVCVSYFLMGLATSVPQVLYFLLVEVLIAYCGQSIGLVVACAVPERLLAMILTPLSIAPFIVFTPYALPYPNSVPVYLIPFQYASPFWWSFSGLVANEMQGLLFDCAEADQVHVGDVAGIRQCSGAVMRSELPAICPYRKGRDVLDHFNIPSSRSDLWQCAWVLAMLAMGYRMLAFALLKWLSRRSRG